MQQSWRKDPDKLTFIICLPLPHSGQTHPGGRGVIREGNNDSPKRMLGDVNLFLRVEDDVDAEEEDNTGDEHPPSQIIGEIELMIAEKTNQSQGFGRASLLTFMRYLAEHEEGILGEFARESDMVAQAFSGIPDKPSKFHCLSVKIGAANTRSLALFESLSFRRVSETPSFFGEFELRRGGLEKEGMKRELESAGVEGYVELGYGD